MGGAGDAARPMGGCGFRALYSMFRCCGGNPPHRARVSSVRAIPRSGVSTVSRRRRGRSDLVSLLAPPDEMHSPASTAVPRSSPKPQVSSQQKADGLPLESPARQPPRKLVMAQVPTISGELNSMLYDHQRVKGSSGLVRASSGNVMLFGYLGNLRGSVQAAASSLDALDYLPKTAKEAVCNGRRDLGGAGRGAVDIEPPPATCRVLSKRLQLDKLSEMAESEYGKGKFTEALLLYEQAIALEPGRAPHRHNKAAALIHLGRPLEAVAECKRAVKIDPSYCKAHHQLATLYFRLGEAGRAMHHYKQSGSEASAKEIARTTSLQNHLTKCKEARKRRDWQTVLNEAKSAESTGADSAPQVFAWQAEALLKLQNHDKAESILIDAPTYDVEASIKFFGASCSAYVLLVQALVDMATGRFEDAVSRAQEAAQIDLSNRENGTVARRIRAVSLTRRKGNDLFMASKFIEACAAYGEGLERDPHNSVLLCNRAACQSKLGQWDKAIEDCTSALSMRPSYRKARLRRADCYAKLQLWEKAVQDYQILLEEMPGDEEVLSAIVQARKCLKEKDAEGKGGALCAKLVGQ